MRYTRHLPSSPLDAYIDDLYCVDGPAPYSRLKILPMPSLHLMVNFGEVFQVRDAEQGEPIAICTESWWVGIWSKYHIVHWPQNVRFFGIHFKPGGAYPFLHIPLSELHNQVVSLDTIWGHFASELRERLYAAPTIQAGLTMLEQFLLTRLCEVPDGLDVVQQATGEIARQHGVLSVRALSDKIGISQNHLGTRFKQMVGVPPKELARFYRFAEVLRSSQTGSGDWGLITRRYGYYDQSHLYKDFVAFTGHSPTEYLQLRSRLLAENLGQIPID